MHVDQIDTFEAVREVEERPKQPDLQQLKEVSETQVKSALAEIIGEPTVPSDWGVSHPTCSQAVW